jgi:hypothetical protein
MLERAVGAASNGWLVITTIGGEIGLMEPGSHNSSRAFNCMREEAIRRKDLSERQGTQWSEIQLFQPMDSAAGCRVSTAGARKHNNDPGFRVGWPPKI